MRARRPAGTLIVLLLAHAVMSVSVVSAQPTSEHGLHYTRPATTWDEALPLGNGMMGALMWGDGHPLRFSLDRADLWDTRPVPDFSGPDYKFAVMRRWHQEGRVADLRRLYVEPYQRPAPTKIPAGGIELRFPERARLGRSDLRLANALASTHFDDRTSVVAFVHGRDAVGMVRIRGASARPEVALTAHPFSGRAGRPVADQTAGALSLLGYPAPVETSGSNWRAFFQRGAEGFRFAARAHRLGAGSRGATHHPGLARRPSPQRHRVVGGLQLFVAGQHRGASARRCGRRTRARDTSRRRSVCATAFT